MIGDWVGSDRQGPLRCRHAVGVEIVPLAAISHIRDGTYVLYIEKPGSHRFDLIVVTNAYGSYLKTNTDREQPEKLMSLPDCP